MSPIPRTISPQTPPLPIRATFPAAPDGAALALPLAPAKAPPEAPPALAEEDRDADADAVALEPEAEPDREAEAEALLEEFDALDVDEAGAFVPPDSRRTGAAVTW